MTKYFIGIGAVGFLCLFYFIGKKTLLGILRELNDYFFDGRF